MLSIALILTLPMRGQQEPVAPGLSPAHAALKGGATTAGPPATAKKPLNQV
jgi:hypothetical protein